jgi:hypothetical protein
MRIGKNDIVLLPDGSIGKVLDRLMADNMIVYKIQKGEEVYYFDENKVTLKKRHVLNTLLNLFRR